MERKEYTQEERTNIELMMDNYISVHDRYAIRELCTQEEYALYYFINRAMDDISTLEHIKNIIN